jgi:hypothetical protein
MSCDLNAPTTMPKLASKSARTTRLTTTTKYDAHHTVLSKTYGALADLRRELADSKSRVAEREEVLRIFSTCNDSQRAWLLLEDYFEKLSLSRKDFAGQEWWPRLMAAQGKERIEEVAMLFLRANRPLPTELFTYANPARFAALEQAEQEQKKLQELEYWLCPPAPAHLDGPRAALRVVCAIQPANDQPALHHLRVRFSLFRPRTGEKIRQLSEIVELTTRATQSRSCLPPRLGVHPVAGRDGERRFRRERTLALRAGPAAMARPLGPLRTSRTQWRVFAFRWPDCRAHTASGKWQHRAFVYPPHHAAE